MASTLASPPDFFPVAIPDQGFVLCGVNARMSVN